METDKSFKNVNP